MTRIDADLERAVRRWLDDPPPALPQHVFDAVVDRLPATRQTRILGLGNVRGSRLLVAAAAAAIVLVVAILGFLLGRNIGDEDPAPTWQTLPRETSVDGGAYLVSDPFPVPIGVTIPRGWSTGDLRSTFIELGRDEGGASIGFTFVEGVYADPCHNDAGLLDPAPGPSVDDLAAALARLPGLTVSGPADVVLDGRPAVTLTLTAPAGLAGCTAEPQAPLYKIWGVPEWYAVDPGQRSRIWIVNMGTHRLVIAAAEHEDSTPLAVAELNAIVGSIDLDPAIGVVVGSAAPEPTLRPLPASGTIEPGDYVFDLQLHRIVGDLPFPLAGPHRVEVGAPDGWVSAGRGIELHEDGRPVVGLAAWAIARIYADPCHWQSATPALVDAAELRTADAMAGAFSRWWTESPAPSGFEPPPDAPTATEPMDVPRYGRFGSYVELTIPLDLDIATCDDAEYRLWEDALGRPRSARAPGEEIAVYVVDEDPGLAVIDAWTLPEASDAAATTLDGVIASVWIHPPMAPTSEE